jgi:hypothetical protein
MNGSDIEQNRTERGHKYQKGKSRRRNLSGLAQQANMASKRRRARMVPTSCRDCDGLTTLQRCRRHSLHQCQLRLRMSRSDEWGLVVLAWQR